MLRSLLLLLPVLACAADPTLVIDLTLTEGSSDVPMIVMWVEKTDGTFVRTVHMFSKDKKYYKDMLTWAGAREGRESDIDAVVGPTPAWGGHTSVRVPAGDLLKDGMVLRIEQRKDKAGHYKKRKLPLSPAWPGVTLDKEGYLQHCTITVEK